MTAADKAHNLRLRQVRAVILGNRPDTSLSSTLYPVYVAVILAGSYGVPAAQHLFRSIDPRWLADHAWTPVGAMAAATTAAALLALVWLVGRVHGPVVPPLPYLELVVASPLPRKVTLARHWRLSLGGSTFGGLLVGAVAGAGPAIAKVAPPIVLLPATLVGCLLGVLVAEMWLQGQLRGQMQGQPRGGLPPGLPTTSLGSLRGHPRGGLQAGLPATSLGSLRALSLLRRRRNALALLDITSLRRQAASNVTMGGAVLAGDLRTIRLDAARPTTRARAVRLRVSGPLTVIARRDLLGLRRAPGSALYGLGLAAAGSAGLMLSLQSPRTSTLAPLVSLVLCHLGFGAWCEGLRLHADNSGTSRLLGLSYRDTALAHLVMPVSAWSLTSIVVCAGLLLAGWAAPTSLVWALGVGALLTGARLLAAFRGLPSMNAIGGGVPSMLLWYAKPLLATLVVGTATAAWAARAATLWPAFSGLLVASAGVVAWGLSLVDKRDRRD